MSEKKVLDAIHRMHPGARLFRNDCGTAIAGGKVLKMSGGVIAVEKGRRISYGLLPGSADLVGWTEVRITDDMVGQKVAVFTSYEAKTANDRVKEDQRIWARNVRAAGGLAKILRETPDGWLVEEPF